MQVHEHTETALAQSKQTLADALKRLQDQTAEIGATEERLTQSEKQQRDILATAEMGEEAQVEALSKIVALGQILKARVEQGTKRLDSLKGELRTAAESAMKTFQDDLAWLQEERRNKHLGRLKAMVGEQWPWCEVHALAFIRHTPDLKLLDTLGEYSYSLLKAGSTRMAAEQLLQDVTTLETEKAGER
jgi:hypothetical protein